MFFFATFESVLHVVAMLRTASVRCYAERRERENKDRFLSIIGISLINIILTLFKYHIAKHNRKDTKKCPSPFRKTNSTPKSIPQ